jgi:ATP-dependent Lon protease
MEIIDISGYLLEEKVQIAKKHLLPRQYKEHGIKKEQVIFDKNSLVKIIDDYTRESGVRNLEKRIAKILRNKAREIVLEKDFERKLNTEELENILGVPPFQRDRNIGSQISGVVIGLAYTTVGGEILFIEVSLSKGKGILTLTGNLGDVMKESASLAFEYLKANSGKLNINPDIFRKWNVHIHVPEGATPKDGPSAGITMFTALASAFSHRKAKMNLAMTGEITLRGKVLPVGGIKEKILAAKRAKITDIILSSGNEKDIKEIKNDYVKGLNFYYINEMIEVIDLALTKEKQKTNPVSGK